MIALDIAAPILLMIGLKTATAANVSLLNNFEIAATSLIALFIFKELISKRVWFAIGLITVASMLLSLKICPASDFQRVHSLFWAHAYAGALKITARGCFQARIHTR